MNILKPLLPALALATCLAATATPLPPAARAEVDALLARLQSSGCEFNRNGSWHSGAEAKAHLLKKLDYLEGKNLVTTAEQSDWVGRMLRGKRKMRLSRAGLETMAIIAYKQPVTKSEVEAIRGVDSSAVLATLLERNLVTIRGRSKVVGRPLLWFPISLDADLRRLHLILASAIRS